MKTIIFSNSWLVSSFKMKSLFLFWWQHGADVDIVNDENTLGFHLDLYARYADSVKVR